MCVKMSDLFETRSDNLNLSYLSPMTQQELESSTITVHIDRKSTSENKDQQSSGKLPKEREVSRTRTNNKCS